MTTPHTLPLAALERLACDTAAQSPLLQRALEHQPTLETETELPAATLMHPRARAIETLKMHQPRAAAKSADKWLRQTLRTEAPDKTQKLEFVAALSVWAALQRMLGARHDAVLAIRHVLELLGPQPYSSEYGLALHRAAYVLADCGEIDAGRAALEQAVVVHLSTRNSQHNVGVALMGRAICQLFYLRDTVGARVGFQSALPMLARSETIDIFSAHHGLVWAYLHEERLEEAKLQLAVVESLLKDVPRFCHAYFATLGADVAVAAGETDRAWEFFLEAFAHTNVHGEPQAILNLSFSVAKLLLDHPNKDRSRQLAKIVEDNFESLSADEQRIVETYCVALAGDQLDADLLHRTAVDFRSQLNRMTLGMGRRGDAGRPAQRGDLRLQEAG